MHQNGHEGVAWVTAGAHAHVYADVYVYVSWSKPRAWGVGRGAGGEGCHVDAAHAPRASDGRQAISPPSPAQHHHVPLPPTPFLFTFPFLSLTFLLHLGGNRTTGNGTRDESGRLKRLFADCNNMYTHASGADAVELTDGDG